MFGRMILLYWNLTITFSVKFHIGLNIFSNNFLLNEITQYSYKGTLYYYLIIARLGVLGGFLLRILLSV